MATIDSTEQNPEYTYATAGTYSVKLVVTGTGGDGTATRTDYITVSDVSIPAPVADFSADKTSGDAPLTIKFTDLSTGDGISAWAWDFNNDGTIDSTEQNPEYTYATAGTYSVKLIATGTGGDGTATRNDYITASDVVVIPTTSTTQVPPRSGTLPPVRSPAMHPWPLHSRMNPQETSRHGSGMSTTMAPQTARQRTAVIPTQTPDPTP